MDKKNGPVRYRYNPQPCVSRSGDRSHLRRIAWFNQPGPTLPAELFTPGIHHQEPIHRKWSMDTAAAAHSMRCEWARAWLAAARPTVDAHRLAAFTLRARFGQCRWPWERDVDQPIEVFDLQRMLFGNEPPLFLFEIAVRTLIVYAYTLLLLRWLGSRTVGQLSTVEFLLVIALGSAVGDAMFYPDVPLLHALAVVTVVVVANKLLDILIARSKRAERLLDGSPVQAIENGVIHKDFLYNTALGVSELSQQLRHKGVEHLGQVAQAFVEADGVLTVYRAREERPGLPIVPPWEIVAPAKVRADEAAASRATLSCHRCGTTRNVDVGGTPGKCDYCDNDVWTPARTDQAYRSD